MVISRSGRRLAAALCLSASVISTAPALAAPPPANPFAKVPPLPTACYSSQDQWAEKSAAAFDAVLADHYKQKEINSEIGQKANEALEANPFAMAQAMQQKMMDDPANAQKYMQEMMSQQQQAQAEAPAQHEKEVAFENEGKALKKQYEAALTNAMAAGNTRFEALAKRYSPQEGLAEIWLRYGSPGEPVWVEPERKEIMRLWDAAYASNCAQWWSATGKVHAYLKRYKDYLQLERVPFYKQFDAGQIEQYELAGVATTGWRTTVDYDAAQDYIKRAQDLFQMRQINPRWCGEPPCN